MKNQKIILALILIILALNLVKASDTCSINLPCNENNSNMSIQSYNSSSNDTICIYFFYGKGCPHCASVEPLLDELTKKYSEVEVKSFEVYFNSENQDMLKDFIKRYDIKQEGVPIAFIGDQALSGEKAIEDNLEKEILKSLNGERICPLDYKKVEATPNEISPIKNIDPTISAVVLAALVNSINPCGFSVLIFLLVYLTSLGSRRKILTVGLTYIAVVFIVYFLSGLGLFTVIQSTGVITRVVYKIAAIIAIIAGLINIKDYFWYGKGITLAIPESRKPLLEKYIHLASIPAAIILGILVSLFELPCAGGVYLAILSLLSKKMTMVQGIPYLLLYNLIFVLPLFIILFVIYKGLDPQKAEKWRLEKRKWMRLVMGLIMLILGIIMLLGWI